MEVWASWQHSCGFGLTLCPEFCLSSVHILQFPCLVISCQLLEKKLWFYWPPLASSSNLPHHLLIPCICYSYAGDILSPTACPSHDPGCTPVTLNVFLRWGFSPLPESLPRSPTAELCPGDLFQESPSGLIFYCMVILCASPQNN